MYRNKYKETKPFVIASKGTRVTKIENLSSTNNKTGVEEL